ncbi:uncharacterized protein LOC135686381 [Rhopilema esculentum]|uniref:uncharacterized protein LOC135686381 n=1 Tax=Rhopilema esculentum TaxID=499914 RepID=UPI0031D0C00F
MATGNQRTTPYNSRFTDLGVSVIDQAPESRIQLQFPIYFSKMGVLSVSVIKCVVGSIQVILGIINIFYVPHLSSEIAAPIWCGVLFVSNGIIGCVLWKSRSKCLIRAFCGLSVVSLVFSTAMLIGCSLSLNYFADDYNYEWCSYNYHTMGYNSCYKSRLLPVSIVRTSIGLLGFLMALILIELGCSIAAVFYSCKAYSKCCSTCLIKDCCVCVGCCECDTMPLDQRTQETSFVATQRANPCSTLLNVVISLPGASYLVDTVRSGQNESQAQTVRMTIHPSDSMQTNGSNEQTDAPGSFTGVI